MDNIQVIDSFLNPNDFEQIQATLLRNPEFPWHYMDYKVLPLDGDQQFLHNFYLNFQPMSAYLDILGPVLTLLEPSAILRIKANLTTRTERRIVSDLHRDYENFTGKTAILYLTTCDGPTVFESSTEVASVANRIVVFPAGIKHAATTTTDSPVRAVINFNYYEWTE